MPLESLGVKRFSTVLIAAFMVLSPLSALERQEISNYLEKWDNENWTYKKEDFAHFDKSDMPILAEFLTHKHGMHAYWVMIDLDYDQCLKYFLQVLPESKYPIRNRICPYLVNRSREADFPTNSVRQIILKLLTQHRFDYHLILALGAVGQEEDVFFIRKLYDEEIERIHTDYSEQSSWDTHTRSANNAKRWACSRLGDTEALDDMASKLIPPAPKTESFANRSDWNSYTREMSKIEYVGRNDLLSALVPSLLYTEEPQSFACLSIYTPKRPPLLASEILAKVVPKNLHPTGTYGTEEYFEKWTAIIVSLDRKNGDPSGGINSEATPLRNTP